MKSVMFPSSNQTTKQLPLQSNMVGTSLFECYSAQEGYKNTGMKYPFIQIDGRSCFNLFERHPRFTKSARLIIGPNQGSLNGTTRAEGKVRAEFYISLPVNAVAKVLKATA